MWPYMMPYPWSGGPMYPYYGYPGYGLPYTPPIAGIPKEQLLAWLRDQEKAYDEGLKEVRRQIEELEKEGK